MANTKPSGSARIADPYLLETVIPRLMETARTGNADQVHRSVDNAVRRLHIFSTDVLDTVTDPDTGDSVLHVAAANGNLDGIRGTADLFAIVCYKLDIAL